MHRFRGSGVCEEGRVPLPSDFFDEQLGHTEPARRAVQYAALNRHDFGYLLLSDRKLDPGAERARTIRRHHNAVGTSDANYESQLARLVSKDAVCLHFRVRLINGPNQSGKRK